MNALGHAILTPMTIVDFRRLALSLPGSEEASHMGVADFRVNGRIFATLAHAAKGFGNLMLTPEVQAAFVAEAPQLFAPVAGGWGQKGATHIALADASEDVVAGALHAAWKLCMAKSASPRKKTRRKPIRRE